MDEETVGIDEFFPGFEYAREKLGTAVRKLATGKGEIKARLSDAYVELAILQMGDLPEEYWKELHAIRQELTHGKMQYETRVVEGELVERPMGKLPSTLRYMRLNRAQKIAERICALEAKVKDWAEREAQDE